jgi:ribose transport system ATP-binding protein
VATARLFNQSIDVMVLDETSAALTRRESDWLYKEARTFADSGGAVLVVSHRLKEITEHCDEATVMRDGAVVYSGPTPALSELHDLMAAGTADQEDAPCTVAKDAVPSVRLHAAVTDFVGPFDLEVRPGEVIALVGPLSSNLYQVGHAIAGRTPLTSGTREIAGTGEVAFVPENCQAQALLPGMSVRENMTISRVKRLTRFGRIIRSTEDEELRLQMVSLDIQPSDPEILANLLSGGNQQKVVMGRAALTNPRCYVLCEPTRGVDIKTRHVIYRFIRKVSAEGAAVVVVTIDVDDAFAVAHRIGLVRAGGRIDVLQARAELSVEHILEEVDA